MIPKITHQIWMQGFDSIPDKFKKNIYDLHRLNPEYDHKQWNEHMLREECKKYSNECLERFDSLEQMITKVDLGRYVILYNYGGISVDTDMEQIKPLSNTPNINSDNFMISKMPFPFNNIGLVNNAIIITPPNHGILADAIYTIINDKRKRSDFLIKDYYTDHITGPYFMNNLLNNTNYLYIKLDNKYFEPCNSLDIFGSIYNDSIMVHRHEGSWRSWYMSLSEFILILFLRIVPFIVTSYIIYIIYRRVLGSLKSRRRY